MLLLAHPILEKQKPIKSVTNQATLAIVWVGSNPDSEIYVNKKIEQAEEYGVTTKLCHFEDSITEIALTQEIEKLNQDPTIDAIIVQLPLAKYLKRDAILPLINPSKDVDNLTGKSKFVSPMVQGIAALQKEYE